MRVVHEVAFDHDSSRDAMKQAEIMAVLNHGPTLKLKAETPTDIVNGCVTIAFCDTRTFGEEIQFSDGHREIISAENVARYFNDQGHQFDSIIGNKAYGKTIIDVMIYGEDAPPTLQTLPTTDGVAFHHPHATYFQRPTVMPTADKIHTRLERVRDSIEERVLLSLSNLSPDEYAHRSS